MMGTKKLYHQTVDKKCKVPTTFSYCQHLRLDMNITVGSHTSYFINFHFYSIHIEFYGYNSLLSLDKLLKLGNIFYNNVVAGDQ